MRVTIDFHLLKMSDMVHEVYSLPMPNIKTGCISEKEFVAKINHFVACTDDVALISRRNQFMRIDTLFDSVKISGFKVPNHSSLATGPLYVKT